MKGKVIDTYQFGKGVIISAGKKLDGKMFYLASFKEWGRRIIYKSHIKKVVYQFSLN